MKIELDYQTALALVLIILCGICLIYLPHLEKGRLGNISGNTVEHFPSSMRLTESIRKEPKVLIPKIVKAMHNDSLKHNVLPDDYLYLYDYEKNFKSNKVYGDFSSRLEAYESFLLGNKNSFHNLNESDIDNLTKLLNGQSISENDISKSFDYEKEFKAANH